MQLQFQLFFQRKVKSMKQYLPLLRSSLLFTSMSDTGILSVLRCLKAQAVSFDKNEYILRRGDTVESIGLLLSGGANILQEDFWGNQNIVAHIQPGQIFAEAFACTPNAPLTVSVLAAAPCEILFLQIRNILQTCNSVCDFHSTVIRNLLSDLAAKNLRFNEKISHITQRTTRAKILSYLSAESLRWGVSSFSIPFNRQQLADYLSVDRSALSAELSKLQKEGILRYHKNSFTLLKKNATDTIS